MWNHFMQGLNLLRQQCRGRRHHPYAGIGLSVAGMIAAAFGMITPVQGAVFQELIDVAVIGNALRALYDGSAIRAPGLL